MSILEDMKKRAAQLQAENEDAAPAAEQAEAPKRLNPLARLKAEKAAQAAETKAEAPAAAPEKKSAMSALERMRALRKAAAEKEKAPEAPTKEAPKAEEAPEKKEAPKKTPLQERMEALVAEKLSDKKPAETKAKEAKEEVKEEAKEEAPAEKAETPAETEAPAKEAKTEEPKAEEAKEAPAEEEKPKKRRRKAASKKKEEPAEPAETAEAPEVEVHKYVNSYDILGKKVSYDEMAGTVMDFFIDDDWKATQQELTEKMNAIRIEPDMNPGTLKYALAELNNLNDEIALAFVEQKQLLDMLTDKEFGAATALMAMNSRGSNAEERKANGFLALTKARFNGKDDVNLIALINAVKARFVFLNSLTKRIQYKSNTCITMSGAMKMEQSLMTGAQVA